MAQNENLTSARTRKKDEFYTVLDFIEAEVNVYLAYDRSHGTETFKGKTILCPCDDPQQSEFTRFLAQNFQLLGLKKLISTSFAIDSKNAYYKKGYQPDLYDMKFRQYDEEKSHTKGKIFTVDHDITGNGKIEFADLEWTYLEGDGDFRSEEVTRLRDEADIIITNPPFSLMDEFVPWLMDGKKQFLIIGNENDITYKNIFPYFKEGKMWLGGTCNSGDMVFKVPPDAEVSESDRAKAARMGYVGDYTRQGNTRWFTNLEHGIHEIETSYISMEDNLRYNKKLKNKLQSKFGTDTYPKYDDYDAIEVPFKSAIPSDFEGVMGVPVSYLAEHNPDEYEIVGKFKHGQPEPYDLAKPIVGGKELFHRLAIRKIKH